RHLPTAGRARSAGRRPHARRARTRHAGRGPRLGARREAKRVMTVTREPLLAAEEITVRFAGITALAEVSLSVDEGEIVGLIGPNGAGKPPLFNSLSGALRPNGGTVRFAGTSIGGLPTHKRARLGLGRTFQRIELFSGMTVREHLVVAERARRRNGALWKDILGIGRANAAEKARVDAMLEL